MSDNHALPPDHANRMRALDPQRSICVTAPAGSGKTELLTQRVLRLLTRVDAPEEILAITFTRKAAAEMHHRIMSALYAADQEDEPTEPHKQFSRTLAREALEANKQRGWNLLENPGRLRIQTIDSLCASLTRQMPVLSNFGDQPQVTDRPQTHYQLGVRNLVARLERDDTVSDALACLLSHVDNDYSRLQRLLISALEVRDQWLMYLGAGGDLSGAKPILEQTLQRIVTDILQQLTVKLRRFAPDLIALLDYAGHHAPPDQTDLVGLAGITELPAPSAAALDQWQALVKILVVTTPKLKFRESLTKNCGFPTETRDGDKRVAKQHKAAMKNLIEEMQTDSTLLSALEAFLHCPASHYSDNQWSVLKALFQLLPALAVELTLVFQQQGCVDFTQIVLAALQGLGDATEPTELALALDYRLKHILIDEFQDTSSVQFRLLEKLVEGWAEHNRSDPENGHTLFLVGDGMQSIYGFRNANVGLFLEARQHGVNGIELDDVPLTVNFRSDPAVVDWNNRQFTRAFPTEINLSRGAVPYQSSEAFNAQDEASDVQVLGFYGEGAETREANYLADLIVEVGQRQPEQSIAVLVRSRSHLRALIAVLSARGLSWKATDIDNLGQYACIRDLHSLTRALTNLADRTHWAALLRTPWFGLDNRELHALLSRSGQRSVWALIQSWPEVSGQLSPASRQLLATQVPVLAGALETRQRLGFREWLEGIWMALGGPATLNSARELEMVDSYLDTLEQYQTGGVIAQLADFEEAIQQLYAKPVTTDCNLHLMTIHKSKGLEFDTVILPGLARSPRRDDIPILASREYLPPEGTAPGLVLSPLPASAGSDRINEHVKYERGLSQTVENTRLLYVAATRAVRRLYLSFSADKAAAVEEVAAPPRGSLLSCIWPGLEDEVRWFGAEPRDAGQLGLEFGAGQSPVQPTLVRLGHRWSPPSWSFPNPLGQFYLDAEYREDNIPEPDIDRVAAATGTVIHRILETLQQRGIGFWQAMGQEQCTRWLARLLQQQGLNSEQLDGARESVLRAVTNTVEDGRGRWLLSRSHKHDYSELAVSSCLDGVVKHRAVDRVLYDEQGALWIVDYKTAMPRDSESRQQFVSRESALYRAQLLDYKRHIEGLLAPSETVKLGLFFTALPLLHEIS